MVKSLDINTGGHSAVGAKDNIIIRLLSNSSDFFTNVDIYVSVNHMNRSICPTLDHVVERNTVALNTSKENQYVTFQ